MKFAVAVGIGLIALAYSQLPGFVARFAGIEPQTSFDVDLASLYLGLVCLAGATIGWFAKRMKLEK